MGYKVVIDDFPKSLIDSVLNDLNLTEKDIGKMSSEELYKVSCAISKRYAKVIEINRAMEEQKRQKYLH